MECLVTLRPTFACCKKSKKSLRFYGLDKLDEPIGLSQPQSRINPGRNYKRGRARARVPAAENTTTCRHFSHVQTVVQVQSLYLSLGFLREFYEAEIFALRNGHFCDVSILSAGFPHVRLCGGRGYALDINRARCNLRHCVVWLLTLLHTEADAGAWVKNKHDRRALYTHFAYQLPPGSWCVGETPFHPNNRIQEIRDETKSGRKRVRKKHEWNTVSRRPWRGRRVVLPSVYKRVPGLATRSVRTLMVPLKAGTRCKNSNSNSCCFIGHGSTNKHAAPTLFPGAFCFGCATDGPNDPRNNSSFRGRSRGWTVMDQARRGK